MDFSWSEAIRIALVGFIGVFTILLILALSLSIISILVRKFETKVEQESAENKPG